VPAVRPGGAAAGGGRRWEGEGQAGSRRQRTQRSPESPTHPQPLPAPRFLRTLDACKQRMVGAGFDPLVFEDALDMLAGQVGGGRG
jgi:hypothetical protein